MMSRFASFRLIESRKQRIKKMAITKEKAKKIAQEYQKTNFLNKSRALINCGYSESYANCGLSNKIYENILVMEEINKLQQKEQEKIDYTREKQLERLQEAFELAEKRGNPSAMVAAIREMNEMLGYHRENAPNPEKQAEREKRSKQEAEALRRIARIRTEELARGRTN